MGRAAQDVTDAELAVLKILWSQGISTIRQITDQLYPQQSESDYATVKKLLDRLEKKRFVRRDRKQMAHTFEAILSLDDLLGRRLESLAKNLCDGSSAPLLMHLIGKEEISTEQRDQLRALIENIASRDSKKG